MLLRVEQELATWNRRRHRNLPKTSTPHSEWSEDYLQGDRRVEMCTAEYSRAQLCTTRQGVRRIVARRIAGDLPVKDGTMSERRQRCLRCAGTRSVLQLTNAPPHQQRAGEHPHRNWPGAPKSIISLAYGQSLGGTCGTGLEARSSLGRSLSSVRIFPRMVSNVNLTRPFTGCIQNNDRVVVSISSNPYFWGAGRTTSSKASKIDTWLSGLVHAFSAL